MNDLFLFIALISLFASIVMLIRIMICFFRKKPIKKIIIYFASCFFLFIILSVIYSENNNRYFKRAEAFRVTGELEKSIHEYKMAIDSNPTNLKYYYGLAQVYEIQDSLENAEKLYEIVIKLSKDSSRYISKFNLIKAKNFIKENDYGNALLHLYKSNEIIKDSLMNIIKLNLIKEAKECYEINDYKKSEQILLNMINYGINDENIIYELSKVYLQQGNFEKRIEFLKKAISINPTNRLYYYELGKHYYNTSRFNLAIKEFEKSEGYKDSKNLLMLSNTRNEQELNKKADKYYFLANKYFSKTNQNLSEWDQAKSYIDSALSILQNKKNKDLLYKLQIERLLFFEGNSYVKMALKDNGIYTENYSYKQKRSIYVWIFNTSDKVYHVNPLYFTMIGNDGYSYRYDGGDFPAIDLQPGTKTSGKLYFYTISKPKKIIFDSFQAGKIERIFPDKN